MKSHKCQYIRYPLAKSITLTWSLRCQESACHLQLRLLEASHEQSQIKGDQVYLLGRRYFTLEFFTD
uniref:Uncharacterized protein n=1 Tax=Arundo donax TaxID=35708 RepID=A0A0A9AS86_ARUDO